MIPPPITDIHLGYLDRGISILGKMVTIPNGSPDQIKQTHLLRVIGHFANIVAVIIEATDHNEDNIPDLPLTGITIKLVVTVVESFADALDSLVDANILNSSELSQSVRKLKDAIILNLENPNSPENKVNLENFLTSISQPCS